MNLYAELLTLIMFTLVVLITQAASTIICFFLNRKKNVILCSGIGCETAHKCHRHTAEIRGSQKWFSANPKPNKEPCDLFIFNGQKDKACDWPTRGDGQYRVRP